MYRGCSFGEPIPPLFLGWWTMTIASSACSATAVMYLFVGTPSVGVTTQFELFCKSRGVPGGSLNSLLSDTEHGFGSAVWSTLACGGLVDDDKSIQVVSSWIGRQGRVQAYALDGFPMTQAQAEFIHTHLSERRCALRVVHLVGPTTFSSLPCQYDEAVFNRRLRIYRQQTVPAVAHFRQLALRGADVEVNGISVSAVDEASLIADIVTRELRLHARPALV